MTPSGHARIVFISYAHEDADLLDRLLAALKPLVRNGHVETWVDREIGVARRWNDEIETNLHRAEVAILMLSIDFLASDYIMDVELPRLVGRGVPLVCVPAGDCSWKDVEAIASVQWPLRPDRPLRGMKRAQRDSALVHVYKAVRDIAVSLGHSVEESNDVLSRTTRLAVAPTIDP